VAKQKDGRRNRYQIQIGAEASGGELRALSRQAMRSYARYWLEAFRLPVVPVDRLVGVPVD